MMSNCYSYRQYPDSKWAELFNDFKLLLPLSSVLPHFVLVNYIIVFSLLFLGLEFIHLSTRKLKLITHSYNIFQLTFCLPLTISMKNKHLSEWQKKDNMLKPYQSKVKYLLWQQVCTSYFTEKITDSLAFSR